MKSESYDFIVHLSDIHIRHEMDREEEYSLVFDNLFISIKEKIQNQKTLIIFTGDLIHNKVRITPIVLYLVDKLLMGLSELGTVVLIDGNHDINVGNEKDKKLLEVINKPKNVYYFDHTCEHVFDNITLGISTLVDNKFIAFSDLKSKNDINIAIGHYSLKEWFIERKILIMTRVKSVKDFVGYDYALLGDIHSRKTYNNCRYAGSLLQQNFSETGKHGYSILDITKEKWKKVVIPSDYSFRNIYVDSDGKLILSEEVFTKYSYIKLHLDRQFLDKESEYRKEIESYTIIKRFVRDINTKNKIFYSEEDLDIDDRELENAPLTEEQIIHKLIPNNNKIIELHNKFKNESHSYHQNRTKWILKSLRFDNILKYRGEHFLDFEHIRGINGISGLNASGKSSILKILIFGLSGEISVDYSPVNSDYTKTSQSYNHYKFDTTNLLNYDLPLVKKGFIEVHIMHGNEEYKIYRFIERKGSNISTNTTISKIRNDRWPMIHTSLPRYKFRIPEKEVNKVLYNMIGRSTDLFLLNVINKILEV